MYSLGCYCVLNVKGKIDSVAKYIWKCFCIKCFHWRISQAFLDVNVHYETLKLGCAEFPKLLDYSHLRFFSKYTWKASIYEIKVFFFNSDLRKYLHAPFQMDDISCIFVLALSSCHRKSFRDNSKYKSTSVKFENNKLNPKFSWVRKT